GNLTLRASADKRPHTASAVLVSKTLALGDGELQVDTYASAESISNGVVRVVGVDGAIAGYEFDAATAIADKVTVSTARHRERGVVGSRLEANNDLYIAGPVDSDSTLVCRGSATLDAEVSSILHWTVSGDADAQLSISAPISRVVAKCAENSQHAVALSGDGSVGWLKVDGAVTLSSNDAGESYKRVSLASGSRLSLDPKITGLNRVEVAGRARLATDAWATSKTLALGMVATSVHAQVRLATAGARIKVSPAAEDPSGDVPRLPLVAMDEGELIIEGDLPMLCAASRAQGPGVVLTVPEGCRFRDVVGTISLRSLEGRIESDETVAEGSEAGTVTRSWLARYYPQDSPSGAPLGETRHGQLIGVDISRIRYADVPQLRRLHVLNPPGRPLIAYAKALDKERWYRRLYRRLATKAGRAPLYRPDYADDLAAESQKLREIADVLRTRANSGATYSAAEWAAAHAHALQIRTPKTERLMRGAHRLLGYGVRPAPALFTLATGLVGVAVILMAFDGADSASTGALNAGSADPDDQDFRSGEYGFWESLWRAVLLPAGFLRSDVGGATAFRPVFGHPGAHFLFVLATGVIIGFVAVALKNFLLRPKADG
ncbi:MAG: hypothetical protein ACK5MR_09930, partial [Cumulibacter sp.]